MDYSKYLDYCPVTGNLIWKETRGRLAKKGEIAGVKGVTRYSQVKVNGIAYMAHRIVWEIHNGPIPKGMEIDHINHQPRDNRIENLRLVTRTENNRNASTRKDSLSGITGVRWHKQSKKWQARIRVDKQLMSLGLYVNLDDAIKAREAANLKYGFHDNHGKRGI